jgi:hypothetical protein
VCTWVQLSPNGRLPKSAPPESVAPPPVRKSAKVPFAAVLGAWLRTKAEPQTVWPAEVLSATSW